MNKLTKLLSVFVIAGAIGTGVVGAVGCNKTPEPEGPGGTHTHAYGERGTDNGDGTHKLTCSGCEEGAEGHTKNENHVDANGDDICDKCDADMSTEDPNEITSVKITASKESADAGETINLSVEVKPDAAADKSVTWSITDGDDKAELTPNGATATLKIKDTATNGGEVSVKAVSTKTPTKSHTITININKVTKFHELKADTENNILAEDFSTTSTIADFSGTYGTKGVYANKKGANGTVTVVNGAVVQNSGVTATTGVEVQTIVDFGTVKDVVEGYVEMTLTGGDSWTMFRIQGTDGRKDTDGVTDKIDEVVGLRAAGGKLNYRFGGGAAIPGGSGDAYTSNGVAPTGAVAYNSGTIPVYFKYNKVTQTLTLTVGGVEYLKDYKTQITSVKGLCFATSSDGKKVVTIDNVAINTYDLSDADVAAGLKISAADLNTGALALKGSAWTLTDEITGTAKVLADAKNAVDSALDAVNVTTVDATSAYATYESSVYDALAKEYLARLLADYPESNYTTAGGAGAVENIEENVKAYANAKAAAQTAFNAVDSLDGFAKTLTAQKIEFDKVNDNSYFNKAEVTITVSDGSNSETITGKRVGDTVTKAELKAKVTVPADSYIKEFKLNDSAVTLPYTLTDTDTAITFTAVIEKLTKFDFTTSEAIDEKLTEEKELIEDVLYASVGVNVDANSKTAGGVKVSHRVKLNSAFSYKDGVATGALKLVLTVPAKVTVYSISGNSSGGRALTLYDSTGTATSDTFTPDGKNMTDHTYNITAAGTYYLGSPDNGVNIYRIVIDYTSTAEA